MDGVGYGGVGVVGNTQRTGQQVARMQQVESRGWDPYSQTKAASHLSTFQYSPKFMPVFFFAVISVNNHMD